jgi:hypothetical protein
MRCMQPVYTSSFRTMTFGAYRAFQAWARSTRAVRNHFFLLMTAGQRYTLVSIPPHAHRKAVTVSDHVNPTTPPPLRCNATSSHHSTAAATSSLCNNFFYLPPAHSVRSRRQLPASFAACGGDGYATCRRAYLCFPRAGFHRDVHQTKSRSPMWCLIEASFAMCRLEINID